MKVLITGTAGFIGFHLAQRLLKEGHLVVGIDNINDYYDVELKYARLSETGISREDLIRLESHSEPQTRHPELVSGSAAYHLFQSSKYPNYRFAKIDLTENGQLTKLFANEKFDVVCNLAAQAGVRYSIENPHAYIQSNIVGFMNILEACRHNQIKHLVYASSSSVYGNSDKMPLSTTDTVDNPISLYAATKKSNELMAHTYSHLFGLKTTGLRFFTVYGPWGRPDMAPILFANAITNDKPINVFNNGNLERDFTYIDDIVEGIARVIDSSSFSSLNKEEYPDRECQGEVVDKLADRSLQLKAPYSIYNIGNGTPVKLMDFIKTMENALGKKAEKVMLPMQAGDVYKTFADVSALKNDVGYAPNTTLKEGLGEFAKWYTSYYK